MANKHNIITIIGPTASGKTGFAAALAYALDAEIISGDSRQLYRQMDIGTGKDLNEYIVEGEKIAYHLIDIVDPGIKYNVYAYQQAFVKAFENICSRDKLPILCGGTGMYIEAALQGYQLLEVPPNHALREVLQKFSLSQLEEKLASYKKLHNKTDVDNKRRAIRAIEIADYYQQHGELKHVYPELKPLIIGLDINRELRRKKISDRLRQRLDEGMIDEVKGILDSGVKAEDLIYYGLEYKYVTQHVIGELKYEEMYKALEIAIHQFAKRQMTWFRGMERRGHTIHWLDATLPDKEKVEQTLALWKTMESV